MATNCNVVLALSLLVLTVIQGCSGEVRTPIIVISEHLPLTHLELLDHQVDTLIASMQDVNHALGGLRSTVNQSQHLQTQNSAVLADLQSLNSLPDVVLQLKEQLIQQNGHIELMKKGFSALDLVNLLTQEQEEIKTQLQSKDEMVRRLEANFSECHQQVISISDSEKRLNSTIRDLQVKLEAKIKELEGNTFEIERLNRTASLIPECVPQPRQQEINELVEQFVRDGSWSNLAMFMNSVLNNSSKAYIQMNRMYPREESPLQRIGRNGNTELATLLLCAGMPVNTPDHRAYLDIFLDGVSRDTILHSAASGGHLQMAKLLLDLGADVRLKGLMGMTPLIAAARTGHLEVVKLLMQAGSVPTARDNIGRTALDVAREGGKTEVVEYLERFPH